MAPTTMNSSVEVATSSSSSSASGGDNEVPIFLQKAYHMIDTCDPTICSWSDDGLTFIVRNTHLFETSIIPQFFKHNKFSSFVRQLNFYGFRKVKFSDSLRIDHKLEAETAKYWRFKHDKFRRGRMDLLSEIKRTPSATTTTAPSFVTTLTSNKTVVATSPPIPSIATSMQSIVQRSNGKPPEEVTHLKSEMQELKQRVESMTKSIDELTDLVKNVSVKEEMQEGGGVGRLVTPKAATVEPERGNKRKKTDTTDATPATASLVKHEIDEVMDDDLPVIQEWIHSSSDVAGMDSLLFSDEPLPDLTTSLIRTGSPTPSDDTFVDDLFQAFVGEDSLVPELETDPTLDQHDSRNTPDPLLMKRIEDSLSTLPRDMHEMVANRLIDAISNSRPIVESASSLFPSCQQSSVCETVADDRCHILDECEDSSRPATAVSAIDTTTTKTVPTIPLPLAVATLKTILAEYGVSVECTHRASCKDSAASLENRTMFTKSLPVVPMNA